MDPGYHSAYAELHVRHWWWRARRRIVLDEIHRARPAGDWGRILDVGCGDGLLFPDLARLGRVSGVEPVAEVVTEAGRSRGTIHVRPFDRTFAPGERYGLILMLDVLEHMDDPADAVEHAADLLEPGGTLLVTVPAFRALWTAHDELNAHRTRYSRSTLRPVLEAAGLRVRRMRYLFHWLAPVKLGVRLAEAVRRPAAGVPRVPPAPVNRILERLSAGEQHLPDALAPPFGGSLLARATRG